MPPLLDGPSLDAAVDALDALSRAYLALPEEGVGKASLSGGDAGVAIVHAYLAQALPDRGHEARATQALDTAMARVAAEAMEPSLYAGFTGVAWAIEHLCGDPEAEDDPNEAADDALQTLLAQSPWERHFDLITGLVGFGAYALERWPRPWAHDALVSVVDRLAECAERRPPGIAWPTRAAWVPPWTLPDDASRLWDCGVAHGAAGVVALLAETCARGVAVDTARPLLDGAVAWLLAQRMPDDDVSILPSWVRDDEPPKPARLSWCYGELGTGLVLLRAARALGEAEWERAAIALGRAGAARSEAASRVQDACLCHGAAGNGHLLQRFHRMTGDAVFAEVARAWFDRALATRRAGAPLAGFQTWTRGPDGEFGWTSDPGLLSGAGGVALALAAATTEDDAAWGRALLLF
jgi:hypothetical protein